MNKKPFTPIWLVWLRGKAARYCGFALAVIDAAVSYRGLISWGYPQTEAVTIAVFIGVVQFTIAYLMTSGYDIGSEWEARFFSDGGLIGGLKRLVGVLILIFILGFYIFDIASNYACFTGGQLMPSGNSGVFKALFSLAAAIALSLGDELLHLLADLVHVTEKENEIAYHNATSNDVVLAAWHSNYRKTATNQAAQQGREAGQKWSHSSKVEKVGENSKPASHIVVPRQKKRN